MFKKYVALSALTACLLAMAACQDPSQGFSAAISRSGVNFPEEAVEVSPTVEEARWTQQIPSKPKLDFLIIFDTSGSLKGEARALKTAFEAYLETITQEGIDLCVGITFARPEENFSYHLFHAPNVPSVLCSNGSDSENAQLLSNLDRTFSKIRFTGTRSEGGLAALRHAITTFRSNYEAEGFYRDRAALSVAFMSDENALFEASNLNRSCFVNPANQNSGYFPELQPQGLASPDCIEARIRYQYYSNADGSRVWNLDDLLNDIQSFQGTLPASFGLIGVKDTQLDKMINSDASITYGYNALIERVDGVFIPLRSAEEAVISPNNQAQFNQSLKKMGQGAVDAATILTVFDLPSLACPKSLEVKVAGEVLSPEDYRSSLRLSEGTKSTRLVINASSAGEPGDEIVITYTVDTGASCA